MPTNEPIVLKRDCEAVLVPSGDKVMLKAGNRLTITQALGSTYTVVINGNMARIDGKDSDAIGQEPVAQATNAAPPEGGTVDPLRVWEQMKTCFDPEIPVNIVDLGLVYDCQIAALPGGGNRVEVKMTLTAPGCGMGSVIATDVESRIRQVPGVTEVKVELVWEPMWNQAMMSEAARLQLGLM